MKFDIYSNEREKDKLVEKVLKGWNVPKDPDNHSRSLRSL